MFLHPSIRQHIAREHRDDLLAQADKQRLISTARTTPPTGCRV